MKMAKSKERQAKENETRKKLASRQERGKVYVECTREANNPNDEADEVKAPNRRERVALA